MNLEIGNNTGSNIENAINAPNHAIQTSSVMSNAPPGLKKNDVDVKVGVVEIFHSLPFDLAISENNMTRNCIFIMCIFSTFQDSKIVCRAENRYEYRLQKLDKKSDL